MALASMLKQSRTSPVAFSPVSTGIGCEPLPRSAASPLPVRVLSLPLGARGGTEVFLADKISSDRGGVRELDDRIARLELRAEQLGIHLQDLSRNGREATQVRSELYGMLQELAELRTEQARRNALLELEEA